jgi:hypothetical protein
MWFLIELLGVVLNSLQLKREVRLVRRLPECVYNHSSSTLFFFRKSQSEKSPKTVSHISSRGIIQSKVDYT